MQFAIVDIETTGGHASGSAITEIAIIIHDGRAVLETFETLIDPGCAIPRAIQSLTGIDETMTEGKPSFGEIAGQVFDLLSGRVFVAHNVNFDYSFIRHHLAAEGYELNVPKLCTIRLSRKLYPGLPSYSPGRLCRSLDIPLEGHHRAGGDARATAVLFARLHLLDSAGHIAAMLKKGSFEQALPPNLNKDDFNALPAKPGVYYFRDMAAKVIYVGKAIDIRRRVSTHFTGNNTGQQRQNFLRNIYSIRYERCGTELMALLLEASEIKRLWPPYNRAMKHKEPKYGLYAYENLDGYLRLAIGNNNKFNPGIHVFHRQADGINMLHKMVQQFNLCYGLTLLRHCEGKCGDTETACTALRSPAEYNMKVEEALRHVQEHLPSFAIIDTGRNEDEYSCIWVERGNLYGMGYIDNQSQLQHGDDIKSMLVPYNSNHYMMQLIFNYAEKYPRKVKPLPEHHLSF